MGDVLGKFIAPLERHFVLDHDQQPDPAGFTHDVVDALSEHDDAVLADAARHLQRTHRFRRFPTLAECIQACAAVVNAGRAQGASNPDRQRDASHAQRRARQRLMASQWAAPAAEQGWIAHLEDHYLMTDREPTQVDVEAMVRRMREADACIAEWRDEAGKMAEAMRRFGEGIEARRRRLAALVASRSSTNH